MLNKDMTLKEMVQFEPEDIDMLSLPLEAVVYIKVSIISMSKEDNYNFIKFFFSDEEINTYINDIARTVFYDFDGTKTDQEKFITIFDCTGKTVYEELSIYLEEVLNKYTHEANAIIDLFTHNNKKYRLSNLEEVVKLEELNG